MIVNKSFVKIDNDFFFTKLTTENLITYEFFMKLLFRV